MRTPKLLLSIYLAFLTFVPVSYSQDGCGIAQNTAVFSGNRVEALLRASGSSFWDGQQAGYYINTEGQERVTTIFANGLWIGGKDPGGNVHIATAKLGLATGDTDYYPGPLKNGDPDYPGGSFQDPLRGTTDPETCQNWDKVWVVTKDQIESFRMDFQDDGVLEAEHPAIFSWPGEGNIHFAYYNGFEFSAHQTGDLAPFYDKNFDGSYNPADGDYPQVEQSESIPDIMAWSVFNDSGGPHGESGGSNTRLLFDIQQTTWVYQCSEVGWLDKTVFASYKIFNRGIERRDSMRFGLWTDFDLGCPSDDYIGSAPDLDTYFVYNADNMDGDEMNTCESTSIAPFVGTPPVQAVTFLNSPMSSFIYYAEEGNQVPAGIIEPQTRQEHYNYLSSRFRDGTRLSAGGNGFHQSNGMPTQYAFSGRPDQETEWSLMQNPDTLKRYCIAGSTLENIFYYPELYPGGRFTFDVAYSFHHHPDSNHLQNVNLMYNNIPEIQSLYNWRFNNICPTTNLENHPYRDEVDINLFPNPARDDLTVSSATDRIESIMIYQPNGQEVMRANLLQSQQHHLSLSTLPAGIYFIQVVTAKSKTVKKFVKM